MLYREEDNLGIFDAHDKNVLRSHIDPSILIPFDVIPCHPDERFLDFIHCMLKENRTISYKVTTRTITRVDTTI